MDAAPFWRVKPLCSLTAAEWEALCDGCAKCCVIRLRDVDTDAVYATNVACRLLDRQTCRCTDYDNRSERAPACVRLTPENLEELEWMPRTCAYRLVAEGRELYDWHPLISGDPESVHAAGMSVRGATVCETMVDEDDLHEHVTVLPGEGEEGLS